MLKMKIVIIFLTSFLLLPVIHCASVNSDNSNHKVMAIINGFLIDGTGSAPIPNAVVVIRGRYIEAVGSAPGVLIPKNAETIDIHGYTILPGFINAHVHGGYKIHHLKEWAKAGVTTVRDLSHLGAYTRGQGFAVRDKLLRDNANARLVAVGPCVSAVGGYGRLQVSSPEEARRKVDKLIDNGADLVKIGIEDHMPLGRRWRLLSMDLVKAIVEAAHKRSLPVTAHVSRVKHVEMALEGGVDELAHMIIEPLPHRLIDKIIKKNIYLVPTLEIYKRVSDTYNMNWSTITIDNLRRFVKAGGKVALGTDFGGYYCKFDLGMPITETRLMQKAGMTPMQIIVSATGNAAYVCGLKDKLGTIETGKIADILIVKNNPLDNLNALEEVYMVIHNGEIIRDEGKKKPGKLK